MHQTDEKHGHASDRGGSVAREQEFGSEASGATLPSMPEKDVASGLNDAQFRMTATRIAVYGTFFIAAFFCVVFGYHAIIPTTADGWLLQIVQQHARAAIGVPFAVIAAACIVLIMESTSGPIKFRGLGMTLEGASGPVVFWFICFVAIATAVGALW